MHYSLKELSKIPLNQQGNRHIKRVPGTPFCLDSKPTDERPYSWYARRHVVAGFVNTLDRAQCNCDFVTIGSRIYIRTRFDLLAGTELFVYYN